MEKLSRLQGSMDLAQMKHNAIGTEETKASLEAAQAMYDDAVAAKEVAGNDKTGDVVDDESSKLDELKQKAKEAVGKVLNAPDKPGAADELEKKSEE